MHDTINHQLYVINHTYIYVKKICVSNIYQTKKDIRICYNILFFKFVPTTTKYVKLIQITTIENRQWFK